MKKMEAEEQEQSPGDGQENVSTNARIEGLDDKSDPERSDSDHED